MADLLNGQSVSGCTVCAGALPDGEWCRACGRNAPVESPAPPPMTGLRLAVRAAKGGPLSADGDAERDALFAGLRTDEGRAMVRRLRGEAQ